MPANTRSADAGEKIREAGNLLWRDRPRNDGVPRSMFCHGLVGDVEDGFGKRLRHNLQVMARLSLLHLTGCTVLLGASRKSFIASAVDRGTPPKARFPGSLAAALAALDQGAQILRVHDVAETWQAAEVWRGIRGAA